MRTLAMPKTAEPWSLTSLREKLIKIGAKVVSHGRYVTFQLAGVAVSRQMFKDILMLIARLRAPPAPVSGQRGRCNKRRQRCAPAQADQRVSARRRGQLAVLTAYRIRSTRSALAQDARRSDSRVRMTRHPGNVG